jgi:hypothetical protein
MAALAMCLYGAFVGYIVTTALRAVTTWTDIAKISGSLVAVIGSAGAWAIANFAVSDAASVNYYPVGLCYAALTTNAAWMVNPKNRKQDNGLLKVGYIVVLVFASALLLALLLSQSFRELLPR